LGTSVGPDQRELRVIGEARERRVPTLSVLDFWSHYRERFTSGDGAFILPQAIAVMDQQARHDMVAIGFPGGRLHVTGHPAFDELGRYDAPAARARGQARVRELAGCDPSDLCILYVSQPLSQLHT